MGTFSPVSTARFADSDREPGFFVLCALVAELDRARRPGSPAMREYSRRVEMLKKVTAALGLVVEVQGGHGENGKPT